MLNLLYYYIITVEKLQLVTCTKLYSRSPPFDRRVERMFIRADNLLSVYFDVYKLTRFIDKCSDYFFKPGFPGFMVGCTYHIHGIDIIYNRHIHIFSHDKRSGDEAVALLN